MLILFQNILKFFNAVFFNWKYTKAPKNAKARPRNSGYIKELKTVY